MRIIHYNRAVNLFLAILFVATVIFLTAYDLNAKDLSSTETEVLESAEQFFVNLKERQYKAVWEFLSAESRETIIKEFYNSSRELLPDIQVEVIRKDFESNGVMFNSYWNAFLNSFNPDMILKQSVWKMGIVKTDTAEILLTYKKAAGPTTLKLVHEQGLWKIGLTETFWTRKKFDFLQNILNHIS